MVNKKIKKNDNLIDKLRKLKHTEMLKRREPRYYLCSKCGFRSNKLPNMSNHDCSFIESLKRGGI